MTSLARAGQTHCPAARSSPVTLRVTSAFSQLKRVQDPVTAAAAQRHRGPGPVYRLVGDKAPQGVPVTTAAGARAPQGLPAVAADGRAIDPSRGQRGSTGRLSQHGGSQY